MESIKRLRELAADINSTEIIDHLDVVGKFMLHADWLDSWHKAFDNACKAIEDEIAEKYMRLPVDADGIPIHCCERIVSETGREGDVWLIGVFDLMTSDHVCHDHTKVHHCKPRTLEDVLEEFGTKYIQAVETPEPIVGFGNEIIGEEDPRDVIAKYADEIREMVK